MIGGCGPEVDQFGEDLGDAGLGKPTSPQPPAGRGATPAVQHNQFRAADIRPVGLALQSRHNINFGCASFLNKLQQPFKHQFTAMMQQASRVTKDQYSGCRLGHGFILSSRIIPRPSCRNP